MATTNNSTSIRVKESTKYKLDTLKSNKSYDSFITEMLLYFETTGITPQSKMVSPVVAIKEQTNRVIEVVRGIEKSTNVKLKNIEQLLSRFPQAPATAQQQNPDEFMHISQVQELLERAKEQEKTIIQYREEINQLKTKAELSKQQEGNIASASVNAHKLLEVVERIDDMKKVATFNDAVYEVDRNTFDMWIKRLKDELKK